MAKEGDLITIEEAMKLGDYKKEARDIILRENERKRIMPAETYLEYDNVIYIAVMPDDSPSIAGENKMKRDNTQDVIDGHNDIKKALTDSTEAEYILFKTQYLMAMCGIIG